ncbi:LpqB family beta-propeller domain-containing protein [Actinokineospora cianjurensis]|uniref:Lipoprotein LpqB-like beta-propeller protein n=1 Tax=Actinokineospora cianjurensis TaxID=585224 RepID=A0A421B9L7_9PSEU|nr:LpqB family beta-propeller domain-containing protein [Actinokineospora cianjurensis]RLK61077.1 lipoprotein LpqB-like beta-propeller protein [Actinokineospora cianjurensis]
MIRLVLALVCATLLAGCANIPDRTLPRVVVDATEEQPRQVGKPAPGLDPFNLVQEFVKNAGTPDAARTYLTEEAKPNWKSGEAPTIIQDEFKTIPQSVPEGKDPTNEQVVILTATSIGGLVGDFSFLPQVQSLEYRVVIKRQDGQWRIAEPPNAVLIREADFAKSYRRVNLEFFDPEQRVMVSDPRYVAIEPRPGLFGRVVYLLLGGPSESLKGAVRNHLEGLEMSTNILPEPDGAILINLGKVDKPLEDRQRIAAQLVRSLREVTTSPLRIRSQGLPLVPGHEDWTTGDVGAYDSLSALKADLLGLAVVGGRLYSLRDGKKLDGPTGDGSYDIVSAAQSLDGGLLAVVQRTPGGMKLRVGKSDGDLPEVSLPAAATLTRPTWLFAGSNEAMPNEVWTVQDGTLVVRVVRTNEGKWEDYPVDASEFTRNGGTITQLRLSRDGARVAAVVNGEIRVASVVRPNDAVTIRSGRTLQAGIVKDVVGLDWLDRLTVIAATDQPIRPVVSMSVDGYAYTAYNKTNLTLPVTAVTAAPGRSTIVTDGSGMWTTGEAGKVWQYHQNNLGSAALPFYPG